MKLGIENPTFAQTTAAIASEFAVLVEYLLTSGFANETGLSMFDIVSLFISYYNSDIL